MNDYSKTYIDLFNDPLAQVLPGIGGNSYENDANYLFFDSEIDHKYTMQNKKNKKPYSITKMGPPLFTVDNGTPHVTSSMGPPLFTVDNGSPYVTSSMGPPLFTVDEGIPYVTNEPKKCVKQTTISDIIIDDYKPLPKLKFKKPPKPIQGMRPRTRSWSIMSWFFGN